MSALGPPGFHQVVADLHQNNFIQSNQSLATLPQGISGVWRDGEIQCLRVLRFGDKCASLGTVFALSWAEMGNLRKMQAAPASEGRPGLRSTASTG